MQYLYNLHEVAEKAGDGQFADFVEVMLEEQVGGVKEHADMVAKLRRVGKGLGVYQFDKVRFQLNHVQIYHCSSYWMNADGSQTARKYTNALGSFTRILYEDLI